MFSQTALVDAVAADLETLGLPRHTLWKYLDPPFVPADRGPMLAVYVRETLYEVVASGGPEAEYQNADTLQVAWFHPTLTGPETGGVGDQVAAHTALQTAEAIVARLATYGDKVPGLAGTSEGTLVVARYGLTEGFLWMLDVTLRVARWA